MFILFLESFFLIDNKIFYDFNSNKSFFIIILESDFHSISKYC